MGEYRRMDHDGRGVAVGQGREKEGEKHLCGRRKILQGIGRGGTRRSRRRAEEMLNLARRSF